MMGRVVIAGLLASVLGAGAASAADLSRPMYTKAPPMPMMYNWTGFYVGANVGGSWGRQDTSLAAVGGGTAATNSVSPNGVIGGGQIGYNWQMGSPWVFGLEADIQGSGQRDSGVLAVGPAIASVPYQDKLEWFGTVRGRIGYAIGAQGRWLPYITGGLAYGDGNINGTGTVAGVTGSFNNTNTYVGYTVGAGLEYAFADKWSAKLEYLYMDLGNGPTISVTPAANLVANHMTDNIARAGVNYHF